jgi:hypothetical protein
MPYTLEVEYDYEFSLLGISCHEKDYRLCWLLNTQLGFDFRRADDLLFHYEHGDYNFPVFEHDTDENTADCTLLKNRLSGAILLPELSQIDFLLKVDSPDEDISALAKRIRNIPQVVGTFEIDVPKLRSKDNLILD